MSQLANKVKSDFPIFHDSDLVYLDSAATSQKPQVVLDAVNSVYTKSNANCLLYTSPSPRDDR